MMNPNRIRDIDFWRGAVLIVILVDHIPGNPLENLTPRNFGLSDSAEAFIFLSGLSIGLIYMPRARKYGLEPVRVEQTDHYRVMREFCADPAGFVEAMMEE